MTVFQPILCLTWLRLKYSAMNLPLITSQMPVYLWPHVALEFFTKSLAHLQTLPITQPLAIFSSFAVSLR